MFVDASSPFKHATSTRRTSYILLNPNLSENCIYNKSSYVPEYCRIACTRIRLSSHRLGVETGQWARISFENRACFCGAVQTEKRVLLKTPHRRNQNSLSSDSRVLHNYRPFKC